MTSEDHARFLTSKMALFSCPGLLVFCFVLFLSACIDIGECGGQEAKQYQNISYPASPFLLGSLRAPQEGRHEFLDYIERQIQVSPLLQPLRLI